MRSDTGEWIAKAEADCISMDREMRATEKANYDLVCFLAQQSAEKYLKGLLTERSIYFPKTHDLELLLRSVGDPKAEALGDPARRLTGYAVAFRYPGESASKEEAAQAALDGHSIRAVLRPLLGLES
jgi:HEPN domain-containing protein